MSAFTDILRLAERNNGRIPDSVPHHYVKWALNVHRADKATLRPVAPYQPSLRNVIVL